MGAENENMIEGELSDGPSPPGGIVDEDDSDNNEDEDVEVLKAPAGTPVIVNTTSGREMLIKYTEDCYIHATLADTDDTLKTAEHLSSLVMMLANMRFGGLKEARDRWVKICEAPEVDGG